METLIKCYPDLSQSIVKCVFDQVNGDQTLAKNILKGISNNEPDEDEIQRKFNELQNFSVLGQETVRKVLEQNGWDVEKAIIPLFSLLEEHQKQEKRKKYDEEKKIRIEEAKKKALEFLGDLFKTVPKKQIHQMFETNDGNVDLTTEQLMDFMQKNDQNAKQKKEQENIKNEKRQNREALALRFNKQEKEVDDLLNRLKWEVPTAIKYLLEEEQNQKIERFTKVYTKMKVEDIRKALETNEYDESRAMKFIQLKEIELKKKQELEEQKKYEEKLKIEELRKKEEKIAEEKKKLEALESEKRKEMEFKIGQEKKKLEENKRAYEKVLEEEKILEEQRQIAEENQRKSEEESLKKQRNEVLIEQSLLIAKQIKHETEADDVFNKVIEEHLRIVPGLDNDADVDQKDDIKEETTENPDKIYLIPHKTMVDYGETIILNWKNAPKSTKNNWIGFYPEGSSSKEYVSFTWAEGESGMWEVKAPNISGNFAFRFFVNKSYVNWGSSEVVKVGPTFNIVPKIINNSEVKISVVQLSGQPCPNAWVAMYEPEKDHSSYYTYYYLESNSELTFQIPKVGIWEFRLFPQKAKNMATSCRVNLTGADSLQFSQFKSNDSHSIKISYNILTLDPYVDGAWIGVFTQTETDIRQYRRYRKVRTRSGEIMMDAMKTPGVYEARLFAAGSEKIYCRSNTIIIPPH